MSTTPFWLGAAPLVLASRSAARRALLAQAGVPHEQVAADVDERALEAPHREAGAGPAQVAAMLADAKALAVSRERPSALVLGCDQTLDLDGESFSKPDGMAAAAAQLRALSGRTHRLHSALTLAEGGEIAWRGLASAALRMRPLSERFIETYLDALGPAAALSVGVYQIEGAGVHLFEAIGGDQSTIMGLPLVPLLTELRRRRLVAG